EPDRFFDTYRTVSLEDMKQKPADEVNVREAVKPSFDASQWDGLQHPDGLPPGSESTPAVFRARFELDREELEGDVTWMFNDIGNDQTIYVNGEEIAQRNGENGDRAKYNLEKEHLQEGENIIAIVAKPFVKENEWDELNSDPGAFGVVIPAEQWQRKTFNGLAQVLVQSNGEAGTIRLKANSPELEDAEISIKAAQSSRRPWVK
ncbi:MAG: beta-galactosidase, partial [Marinilabilia sp.]